MEIYKLILGQILRFFFRALAGYLAFLDLNSEQQNAFVETTVNYVLPILILLLVELWVYLKNRYFPVLLETAMHSKPTTTIDEIKEKAGQKTNAPVIY